MRFGGLGLIARRLLLEMVGEAISGFNTDGLTRNSAEIWQGGMHPRQRPGRLGGGFVFTFCKIGDLLAEALAPPYTGTNYNKILA